MSIPLGNASCFRGNKPLEVSVSIYKDELERLNSCFVSSSRIILKFNLSFVSYLLEDLIRRLDQKFDRFYLISDPDESRSIYLLEEEFKRIVRLAREKSTEL